MALVGVSACEKTSLLRTIAALEHPTTGTISINGNLAIESKHRIALDKRVVGLVLQGFALFPHTDVRKNTLFCLNRLNSAILKPWLKAMLSLIQLVDLASRYPYELSGGQQQKVALARALALRPALLLLDELFSGYDVLLREAVRRELRLLLDAAGTTTVLVNHDVQEAVMKLVNNPANSYLSMFMG
jgi:iron(III) transport system ATP-binding protein